MNPCPNLFYVHNPFKGKRENIWLESYFIDFLLEFGNVHMFIE